MGCELYLNKTVTPKIMYVQKQNKAKQKKESQSRKPETIQFSLSSSLSLPLTVISASVWTFISFLSLYKSVLLVFHAYSRQTMNSIVQNLYVVMDTN